MFINFNGKGRGDPVILQVYHSLAHILLVFYLLRNLSCLAFTDPFYFCQPLRFFFNDPECVLFKPSDDPCCQSSTDPFDCAGPQITFNRNQIFRFFDFMGIHL